MNNVTPIGHPPGAGLPQGPAPGQVARRPHHWESEELVAHLTGQHGCQHGGQYVQAVINAAIEARAKVTPAGPDGTIAVVIEGDVILAEPAHRRVMESLHADHSHDYEGADVPAILHGFIERKDGA